MRGEDLTNRWRPSRSRRRRGDRLYAELGGFLAAPPAPCLRGSPTRNDAFLVGLEASLRGHRSNGPRPVLRSLLTLKGLAHRHTGGIVAAAPLRCRRSSAARATGTIATAGCATRLYALRVAGCGLFRGGRGLARLAAARRRGHARRLADHLRRRGRAALDGVRSTLAAGLRRSAPVRIGNAAVEAISARRLRRSHGRPVSAPATPACAPEPAAGRSSRAAGISRSDWQQPDEGMWEVRGGRHFTHSKVMAWVAFDRAVEDGGAGRSRGADRAVARRARCHPRRRSATRVLTRAATRSCSPTGRRT